MSRVACRLLRAAAVAFAGLMAAGAWAGPAWVILEDKKPDGPPELIRIVKEQKGDGTKGKVLLQEADGKSQEVEESRILARIPAYPEGGAKVDRQEAVRTISLLLEAKSKASVLPGIKMA
ncbi:MAG: hypothetical protein EBV83_07340, partial [Verrucomicrobia bacterium]|nr:hypothetical protein [Verrucomicrobiota bacterium]